MNEKEANIELHYKALPRKDILIKWMSSSNSSNFMRGDFKAPRELLNSWMQVKISVH